MDLLKPSFKMTDRFPLSLDYLCPISSLLWLLAANTHQFPEHSCSVRGPCAVLAAGLALSMGGAGHRGSCPVPRGPALRVVERSFQLPLFPPRLSIALTLWLR